MEYRKTTTPSYVNFYLIAANVIYFLFVEWKGSTEDVECMLQWGAMFKPAIVEGKQYWRLFTAMFMHFGIGLDLGRVMVKADLWGAGQCHFPFVGGLVSGKPYGGLSRGVWSDFWSDRWTSVCGWCEPGASGGFKQQTAGNYGSIFPVLWIYQYRREQRGPCGRAGFRNCHGMDIIP